MFTSGPIPTLPFALVYGAMMAFWAWPLVRRPWARHRDYRAVQRRMAWTTLVLLGGMLAALQFDVLWNWGWWGLLMLPFTAEAAVLIVVIVLLQRRVDRV